MELSGGDPSDRPLKRPRLDSTPFKYRHMRYGRRKGASNKNMLRRRSRRRRNMLSRVRPQPEFKTHFFNPPGEINGWHLVGQVDINNNGAYGRRVDPAISKGTGSGERIGAWACLKNMFFDMQFVTQASATNDQNLIIDVWLVKDGPIVLNDSNSPTGLKAASVERDQITSFFYENNHLVKLLTNNDIPNDGGGSSYQPNVNIIDVGSRLNDQNSHKCKLLARHAVSLRGKDYNEQLNRHARLQFYVNCMKKMHFGDEYPHLANDQHFPNNMSIYLCVRGDSGNISNTTESSFTVPVTAKFTGTQFNYTVRSKYYDN